MRRGLSKALSKGKGSEDMRDDDRSKNEVRKVWSTPKLQRIEAGSAESGGVNNVPDGGPPGNARS